MKGVGAFFVGDLVVLSVVAGNIDGVTVIGLLVGSMVGTNEG